jgi:hypothetical protein
MAIAARIAMMSTTTSSSMRVNPRSSRGLWEIVSIAYLSAGVGVSLIEENA